MIYISLGSNLGNRMAYLRQAVALLKERALTDITCSIVIETEAVLPSEAPAGWGLPYLNMIVRGKSTLSPSALLACLKKIESDLGRPSVYERWSPRVIDLDILLWGDQILQTPSLSIPHVELIRRPFLLHLIALMDPLCRHPVKQKTMGELTQTAPDFADIFTQSFVLYPALVGVVNVTPDSFSDGGRFATAEQALEQALYMYSQGAAMIELGAQSTRPGAILLSPDEEYNRLHGVLDALKGLSKTGDIPISIDSFSPEVIRSALKTYPVTWINDVTGQLDEKTLTFIAQQGCSIVAMHALTVPPKKDVRLSDSDNPLHALNTWAETTINRLERCGFQSDKIILDPGIGFGKSAYQSIHLLRQLEEMKKWGCCLLIGHSRKSYIRAFSSCAAAERDLETLGISSLLSKADYLRVHNVHDHQRFLVAQQVIQGGFSLS